MISPGLQTANPPLLLNHQTPLRAKVHPLRYSHIRDVEHFRFMTHLKSTAYLSKVTCNMIPLRLDGAASLQNKYLSMVYISDLVDYLFYSAVKRN